jgi:hypothetical protein
MSDEPTAFEIWRRLPGNFLRSWVKLDGRFATKREAVEAISANQLKEVGGHEYCVRPAGSGPPPRDDGAARLGSRLNKRR